MKNITSLLIVLILAATGHSQNQLIGNLTVQQNATFSARTSGRVPFFSTAGLLSDSSSLTFDASAGGLLKIINPTGIGVTSTDGFVLTNILAATSILNQWSERIRLSGFGWKTNATAASQKSEFIIENQVSTGTASPTGKLVTSYQVNVGGYGVVQTLDGSGNLTVPGAFSCAGITSAAITSGAITTSGNVTINKAGTDTNLQLQEGGVNTCQMESVSSDCYFTVGGSHAFIFRPNGSEVGRITTTGLNNCNIGTTTRGSVACTTLNANSVITASFAGASTDGMDIKETDDASAGIFVSFRNGSNAQIGSIARVTTTNAVAYNTSSDVRLKTNIRDFTDSGRLIDSLRPRLFDWKSGETDAIGFVAQEENAVDPAIARIGAVTVGDDDPQTIHQQWQRCDQALVPIVVAEEKSLRARVANLESQNAILLSRIEAIEQSLNK